MECKNCGKKMVRVWEPEFEGWVWVCKWCGHIADHDEEEEED